MATEKVSLTLDADILAEARDQVGRRGLSSYVNDALRRKLQHDRIGAFLADAQAEVGPIPPVLLEEVRGEWQGAAGREPGRKRRHPASS
jgi:Arc/MetJ family transcription regulator